jgi:subtilisin family serine protease
MNTDPTWTLPPHLVEPTIMAFDVAMALPWHITQYGIDTKVWPVAKGDKQIIGIVDTGVSAYQAQQGDLNGAILDARDFSGSRFGWEDHNGHGTHVAGIAASRSFGVAPGAQLIIGKALGDGGAGSDKSVADALDYVAKKGARIINLSLGSDNDSPTIIGKITELEQEGVLVVAAAGNSGGGVNSPGRDPHTICDAAIDQNGVVASFSCHGPRVDLCAPGVQILSLGLASTLVLMSGTSMSSPWVTGILADYQSYLAARSMPLLSSVREAIKWLTTASDDLGAPGRDEFYGVGLPDADKMFKAQPGHPVTTPKVSKPKVVIVTMDDGSAFEFDRHA